MTRTPCPLCEVGALGPATPHWRGVEVCRCEACGTLFNAAIARRVSEDVAGFGQAFLTNLGAQPAMWQVEVDAVQEILAAAGLDRRMDRPRILDFGSGDEISRLRGRPCRRLARPLPYR